MFTFNKNITFPNKKNDVFTIGELLVDMISTDYDDNFSSNTYSKHFGGSPANISINTKKLGINSSIFSSVGKDDLGEFLINKLKENKIDTNLINRTSYPTSMVMITKSKDTPKPIFYRYSDYHLKYNKEIKKTLLDSKIVHFSAWPLSQSISRFAIEEIIIEAQKNNIIVGFDPNYHKAIWESNHDGINYIKNIISKVDIVKPSEVDAERIFGVDTYDNQVKKFIDLGAKLVIMTLGKDGAIVSNGLETIKFGTLAKEVVDTTGAGDAFWSGFYASLIKGYTLIESLNLGFAVSSFKLKEVGAIVNLPSLETIKELYNL